MFRCLTLAVNNTTSSVQGTKHLCSIEPERAAALISSLYKVAGIEVDNESIALLILCRRLVFVFFGLSIQSISATIPRQHMRPRVRQSDHPERTGPQEEINSKK